MESIINTFHIDWKIIIAQGVNFAVVFVVLYVYALKPLSKLMAERAEKISKGITDAKANSEILSKTNIEYEATLAKARVEANTTFQESKKDAEVKKNQMLEDAKTEVANIIAAGKKQLEAEKIKMIADAKAELVSLTIAATEKVLGSKSVVIDEKMMSELKNM
jgi:F-type H+-transporting ATPase subunit b